MKILDDDDAKERALELAFEEEDDVGEKEEIEMEDEVGAVRDEPETEEGADNEKNAPFICKISFKF